MFGFLKKKLKGAINKITKKVEEEAEEEVKEILEEPKQERKKIVKKKEVKKTKEKKVKEKKKPKKEETEKIPQQKEKKTPKKQGFLAKIFKKEEKEEETPKKEVKATEPKEEQRTEEEKPQKEKGFLKKIVKKITTKKISQNIFNDLFWELELALLENNVAVEVIEKIKSKLEQELVGKDIPRAKIEEKIITALKESIEEVLTVEPYNLLEESKKKKPFIIAFIGVNGSGKTTTIAKLAKYFMDHNLTPVLAAGDTFRAAAIDQLQQHADKLKVKLIKQDYGADAAAVAFDAIKHAESTNKDVVLIDTAGRLHSNTNLMQELEKVMRVAKPDSTIFVGEAVTGNDCVEQAKKFGETTNISGIILAKADVDEKGGAALSVSYVTKKPVLFLGTGQNYEDLEVFNKEKIMENLGLQ